MRSHGGFLKLASEVGVGTTFDIYLPAAPAEAEKGASETDRNGPRGMGQLILVVDDEKHIRQVMRDSLSRHGYRVVTASDGAEASVIFARDHAAVKLVVTDLDMPFVDGLELIRALRKVNPVVPIIVSTGAGGGKADRERLTEIRAIGVAAVLEKPHSNAELLSAVAAALATP